MRTLLLLLPLTAVAYFLWQSTRSRIFLLGIPFLQFFRQSVFFESLKPFWVPGRLSNVTITLLWLVAVWAVCTGQVLASRRRPGERHVPAFGPRPLPEELLLVLLAVVLLLGILSTWFRYGDLSSAMGEAQGVAYMIVGYLLIRGIVSHSDRAEVMRFINAIVVVNTVAAGLFVIHQGLHVPIYSSTEYFQTVFRGVVITRTFAFMSPLLIFALSVSFAKRRWTAWTYVVVAVNLMAVWVSYTRTLLAVALLVAAVSIIARLVKGGQEMIAVRRTLAVVAVIGTLGIALVTVLPTESNYFVSRIQGAMEGGGGSSANSLALRNARLSKTFAMQTREDLLLGSGFVTPAQDPMYQTMTEWSWDSAWIAVVYRMGLAGVLAFGALFLAYVARALWLFFRRDPWADEYGLLWFTFLVATLISSFIGWEFMDQTRYPMNLWYLAFLAAGVLLPRLAEQPAASAESTRGRASALALSAPEVSTFSTSSAGRGGARRGGRGGSKLG
jgi:hypothetical protein